MAAGGRVRLYHTTSSPSFFTDCMLSLQYGPYPFNSPNESSNGYSSTRRHRSIPSTVRISLFFLSSPSSCSFNTIYVDLFAFAHVLLGTLISIQLMELLSANICEPMGSLHLVLSPTKSRSNDVLPNWHLRQRILKSFCT